MVVTKQTWSIFKVCLYIIIAVIIVVAIVITTTSIPLQKPWDNSSYLIFPSAHLAQSKCPSQFCLETKKGLSSFIVPLWYTYPQKTCFTIILTWDLESQCLLHSIVIFHTFIKGWTMPVHVYFILIPLLLLKVKSFGNGCAHWLFCLPCPPKPTLHTLPWMVYHGFESLHLHYLFSSLVHPMEGTGWRSLTASLPWVHSDHFAPSFTAPNLSGL